MFPAIFILLLIGHVYIMLRSPRERKRSQFGVPGDFSLAMATLLFVLDAAAVGFFVLLLCSFAQRWYLRVLFVLAGLLILLLLFGLLFHKFNKRRWILWLVCAALVAGGFGGIEGYDAYIRSITLKEEFDYRTYEPFRQNTLAETLEEPAALRFAEGDRLPRLDGATALYPVYAAFCQAVYPDSLTKSQIRNCITCSTTTGAYRGIVDGDSDMIFAAGPSKEQEAYAAERGVELVYTPIGREAFVFFVHPKNPIDGLTLEELRGIYSGKLTHWNQLGAEGLGEILAYQRDEGSGSQTALRRFVMGDTPLMAPKTEEVLDGMGEILERVSSYENHRNAIGFSFRFYCTALMKGFDVKLLAVNGVAPTVENIENGSYPLASSFYAVTRADADENPMAPLAWITGEQGQTLVEQTGYSRAAP